MLKYKVLVLFLAVALLTGCTLTDRILSIKGSGNVVTQEMNINGFDKVDINHAFDVEITQGDSFRVVVRVDDNLLEHLQVVKKGKTLNIGMKPGPFYNFSNTTQEAEVTMPELTGLEGSEASEVTITGFKSTKDLSVELNAASSLQGDIEAGDAQFDVSSASNVTLRGSAGNLVIDASGSSDVDLSAFRVANADVEASGASDVTVYVTGRLDVEASGASSVRYLGNPRMGRVDSSGASSVSPAD